MGSPNVGEVSTSSEGSNDPLALDIINSPAIVRSDTASSRAALTVEYSVPTGHF